MSEGVQLSRQADLPTIQITEAAKAHFLRYLRQDQANQGVRLSVKKAGCSGYAFLVDYVKEPQANDLLLPLTDSYQVFIAPTDRRFFEGLNIDLIKQGLNSKLSFTTPLQTGQCGCGESFMIDLD